MTDKEPELPPEILVHICIYCHKDKGSVPAANACEAEHEKTMSASQRQQRHAAYIAEFLKRKKDDEE